MRYSRILCILCVSCFLCSFSARAQDDPNFELGLKSYGSYHMGNIDSVSLGNGALNIDIPLISYPQRGGKLKLDFSLHYFNGSFYADWSCFPPPVGCFYIPNADPPGFAVIDKTALGALATPASGGLSAVLQTSDTDGATHILGATGTNMVESVDASGYNGIWSTSTEFFASITDPDGIVYTTPCNYANSVVWYCTESRHDANGNSITYSATTGWTDTMGRSIPPILKIQSTNASDFTNCTGPQPTTVVVLWNPPGVNGGTYPLKFCYFGATVPNPDALQSIVLPDLTAWTIQYGTFNAGSYDRANTPILVPVPSQITFPTGGTLSYGWSGVALCQTHTIVENLAVGTRTLNPNDGITAASVWKYSYDSAAEELPSAAPGTGAAVQNILTDPLGNDSVHTFGLGGCYLYETQTQNYQGLHTGSGLLKTVNTTYTYTYPGLAPTQVQNVVPTKIVATWVNGQTNQVLHTYDNGFTYGSVACCGAPPNPIYGVGHSYPFSGTFGKELTKSEYDYGSGAPGSLLRTTTSTYLALSNSTYLTANLLDLPSSIQIKDGGGTQRAYTTYSYDETGSPAGAHGNLTSTHRWLNTTGTYLVTSDVYNSNGLVTSSTDPMLNPTTYSYTPSSCPANSGYAGSGPTSVKNALNQTIYFCYDLNIGSPISTTDPNSKTTSYQYDSMLRTTQVSNPDGGHATFSYPNANQVSITETINSSANRLSYLLVDGVGRQIRQAVTNGEAIPYDEADICYDGLGHVSFKSYPFQDSGPFTKSRSCGSPELGDSFTYDGLNRTKTITHSDGSLVSTAYSSNSTTVTDEQGKTRQSTADGDGRLTQLIENPAGLNYTTIHIRRPRRSHGRDTSRLAPTHIRVRFACAPHQFYQSRSQLGTGNPNYRSNNLCLRRRWKLNQQDRASAKSAEHVHRHSHLLLRCLEPYDRQRLHISDLLKRVSTHSCRDLCL